MSPRSNGKDEYYIVGMRDYRYWLRIAEDDLTCVRNELAAVDKPWAVIAFHSDLAAEKYLKAYLAFHRKQPERTHDLSALLDEAMKFDPSLEMLLQDCSDLGYFSIDARYPGIPADYSERLGLGAVAASERICKAILERLPK